MGRGRTRRIGRREAEALLSGDRCGERHSGLSRLLAEAAAGPMPHELRDRELVLAAFIRATDEIVPVRQPGVRSLWAWTPQIAVATLVVVLSGMVVAARTGALPRPIQEAAHDILFGAVPASAPSDPSENLGGSSALTGLPSSTPPEEDESDADGVRERCEKIRAATQDGHRVDPADLAALARAAGGEARVTDFCKQRLSAEPNDRDQSSTGGRTDEEGEPSSGEGGNG